MATMERYYRLINNFVRSNFSLFLDSLTFLLRYPGMFFFSLSLTILVSESFKHSEFRLISLCMVFAKVFWISTIATVGCSTGCILSE